MTGGQTWSDTPERCDLDRRAWLLERRAAVEAAYDAEASTYNANPYPVERQQRFVDALVGTCPPDGIVLDAPCGTGQYFARVVAAGRRVVGIDQSAGMLEQARRTGLAVALHRVGLQELGFDGEFDGAMTVDAMENVFPEEWPLVLANLHRAVRPRGHLYLTVEEIAQTEIDDAFTALSARDLPAVRGEVVEGDVAGYHYYPGREQVRRWLRAERLDVVEQDTQAHDGWAYWHLLLRSR